MNMRTALSSIRFQQLQDYSLCILMHFLFIILLSQRAFAQVDTTGINDLYKLTVEEDILNLKVQNAEEREVWAASRNSEKVLETVTATSIITEEEIRRAGATNIAEALRLSPGLLVRQKSNGYFSVHIRSDIYPAGGADPTNYDNSLVLVTINGVPMNDTYQGGIFWEALPVEMNDVERIEIIQTPHSVLYGLNAASGVINIVTKKVETNRLKAQAGFQGGTFRTYAHHGSADFATADHLKFRISTYYNSRSRFQDEYFVLSKQDYVRSDSLLFYHATVEKTNAYTNSSLQNFGLNGYAFWQVKPEIEIGATIGTQTSNVQSVLQELEQLLLSNRSSQTSFVNVRSKFYKFNTNLSYQSGMQDLAVGYEGLKFGTEKLFATADYHLLAGNYQLIMGISTQSSTYNNLTPHAWLDNIDQASYKSIVVPGRSNISRYGAYLNQNYHFFRRRMKVLASFRADYLNPLRRPFLSYQLGSTYKLGTKNVFRAVFAKGIHGAFIQDYFALADTVFAKHEINGQLNPVTLKTYEVGYRINPSNEYYADLTLFSNSTYDFSLQEASSAFTRRNNSDLMTKQEGATVNVGVMLNKFKLQTFITIQHTKVNDQHDWEETDFMPAYFGGLSASYSLYFNKLTVNANWYFYDHYTFYDQYGSLSMSKKDIVNAKLSYKFLGEHSLYFNGKNMINDEQVEFPYADKISRMYLVGVDLVF